MTHPTTTQPQGFRRSISTRVWATLFLVPWLAVAGTVRASDSLEFQDSTAAACCETRACDRVTGVAGDYRVAAIAGSPLAGVPGLDWVFDTSKYPPRWRCGEWSAGIGWLHIVSDLVIWMSYVAIPIALVYFARRQDQAPFRRLFWLFSAFILFCGATHLMEAVIFWWPAYGLAGVLKFMTAVVSVATVVALVKILPQALDMRSPAQLEEVVATRTKELEVARAHATRVIESTPTGVVMINVEGDIVLVNSALEEMFGYDREELLGEPIERLLPQRFRENHPHQRETYLKAPSRREMGEGRDLAGLRKDGSEIPVEIGLSPMPTESEMFVLGSVIDITERKQSEALAAEANERLQQSNTELEQFAYVASHDLQEPLRKISSFCTLLKEEQGDRLDGEGLGYLDTSIQSAERLKTLISDLLAFSRVTTRGKPLCPTDAGECVRVALDNLSVLIEETGAELHVSPLPVVRAEANQLTMVFQNLIGNAIKYRSDEAPKVYVGTRVVDDRYEFFVRDNGIGIDPKFFDKIFQVFQRLHNRREYKGTGIGLALCKRIIERFGGQVRVESEPGAGSTFYFDLLAES